MSAPLRSRSIEVFCLAGTVIVLSIGCAHNGLSTSSTGMFSVPEPDAETREAARLALNHADEGPSAGRRQARLDEIAENLRRGHLEARAGRPEQAARFYERVLRDDPGNAEAHHRLAVLADQAGDFGIAERNYLSALKQRPNNPDLLNDLGYSYYLQHRFVESEQVLRRAAAIDPQHARVQTNLALLSQKTPTTERVAALPAGPRRLAGHSRSFITGTKPTQAWEPIVLTGAGAVELPLWAPPDAGLATSVGTGRPVDTIDERRQQARSRDSIERTRSPSGIDSAETVHDDD